MVDKMDGAIIHKACLIGAILLIGSVPATTAENTADYEARSARLSADPCGFAAEELNLRPPRPTELQRTAWLTAVIQMCTDKDPCAGADIFARRGLVQFDLTNLPGKVAIPPGTSPAMQANIEKVNAAREKNRAELARQNEKARADFQPTLDRLRSACAASRIPAPNNLTTTSLTLPQAPAFQPPVTPATQTAEPCGNLRKAYEDDKNNLVLAYQLKRCVKKARKAVQVQ